MIVVALMGAGCSGAPSGDDAAAPQGGILVQPSASPYSQVTAGPVHALVPDGWRAVPAASAAGLRGGFVASPQPEAWRRMDGSIAGMAATWVDATKVGVPSDFYYLAATGPLLSRLTHSADCISESRQIFLNNRPGFATGRAWSPGDYMASGEGTCNVGGRPTRWAYFVAAPGFGPVRRIGIPSSGLYVIVAVMRDTLRAPYVLRRLIRHTSFGGDRVADFVATTGATFGRSDGSLTA